MDKPTIEALLMALGSGQIKSHGKWVTAECPLARWQHDEGKDSNPSFGIKIVNDGPSFANCYTCGLGGDLFNMVNRVSHFHRLAPGPAVNLKRASELALGEEDVDPDQIPDYEDVYAAKKSEPELHPFPEFWLESFATWHDSAACRDYLEARGVSSEIADKYDLRYDSYQDRICFPVRTFKGVLAGLHGRLLHEPQPYENSSGDTVYEPRYWAYGHQGHRNPHVWYGEQHVDVSNPVIITEGNFDLLKIASVYPNVLAIQGSNFTVEKMRRLRKIERKITWFDYGKAGDKARREFSQWLPHDVIEDVMPSEEEGDAGATDLDEIQRVIDDLFIF